MTTKTLAFAFTLTLAPLSFAQDQSQQPQAGLGGPGESCRARTDCKAELKCLNQVCTDPHEGETCGATSDCGGQLRCVANKCTSPTGTHGGASSSGSSDWMKFSPTDGAIHPYVGITLAGGFDTGGATGALAGGFDTFDGSFLFALDGGVTIGNHQISLELAPYTYIFDGKANGPAFEALANYAYLIPLTTIGDIHVYWPLRFGAGILAGGDNTGDLAFFQLRADVIGVQMHLGHAMIEFHAPSFRYAITDKGALGEHAQVHYLDWLFGITVGYAF